MISEETRAYYDLKKRNDVRESAKRIRRQFLRYKDAEIIYSLQHKKILELASAAGAIYRTPLHNSNRCYTGCIGAVSQHLYAWLCAYGIYGANA